MNKTDSRGWRVYVHKPWVCKCDPNYCIGDLPGVNHREPRNEWSNSYVNLVGGTCLYCGAKFEPSEEWTEIIPKQKYGSWQTNRPD